MAGSLQRVRRKTSIPNWTVHDFRTTFRTHAVRAAEDSGLGVPGHVADAVLGRKEATLGFARYTGDRDRYLLHEKRDALAKWGGFVRDVAAGQQHHGDSAGGPPSERSGPVASRAPRR